MATGYKYSGSWTSSAGVSIQSYPYLIFIVKTVYGAVVHEVSYTNNQYIRYIPTLVAQGFEKSLSKSTAFKVEKSDEVLTLENGADIDEQTSYNFYSIAGEKISEGSFDQKKELNISSLENGIYILNLTNGFTYESVKFVVQK
ncbi:MAG: T9SS type A sorting domain-containing protein [Cytophagaceae bacterium]|nr:T9SS type A sorting domain-containing protein [Cytophagaceae bacterium]